MYIYSSLAGRGWLTLLANSDSGEITMSLNIRKSGEIKIRKKKFRAAFERFFAFRFLTLSWSEWAENEQWAALNKLHAVLRLISGVGVLFVESLLRLAFFKNIIVFQLVLSLICATIHINLSPASLISRHFDSPFDASDYVRLHSTLSKFMMFSVSFCENYFLSQFQIRWFITWRKHFVFYYRQQVASNL